MRAELDGLPEIVHGDMFRVQGKPEELVRRKIYCVDRLAQMTLLEKIPNSYMLAPAIPEHCIQRWNLVQLPCSDNQSLYLNALVYHKQYAMSEIEAGFVQFVRDHKDPPGFFISKSTYPSVKKHWYFSSDTDIILS